MTCNKRMRKHKANGMRRTFITLLAVLFLGLSGNMMAQQITTDHATIDVGQVMFRHPQVVDFELKNNSRTPLSISSVRTDCGCTTTQWPHTVGANKGFKVSATFDAKQMGHFEKQVAIFSNASEQPFILTLKGVVVNEIVDFAGQYPFQLGELATDRNDVEFDDVNRGDRPVQQIHIFNNGETTLEPHMLHLPPYLSAVISPTKLAPQHAGVVYLTLDSHKLRDFGLTQTSVFLGDNLGDKVSADKEISVSAVLLPSFDSISSQTQTLLPSIKLSTENLDLGSFNGKRKLKGIIEITNQGKGRLDIRRLQMFTLGLQVSLNKTHLQPGETAKIKVTATAAELKKARSAPRILMITNDPAHSKVTIHIITKP